MPLKISTCLVTLGLTTALAQAQPIPVAFHGVWATEDCELIDLQLRISPREIGSSQSACVIQASTLRQRPSGITFQFKCTEGRDPTVRDGFTVMEFEAGHGRNVLIVTTFIKGVHDRKDIRPAAFGRCIRDRSKQPYRFTTMEEPPTHWRAYEPQRASRLLSGEPSFDATSLRKDGSCVSEFCTTHNEAERCSANDGRFVCSVLFTERNGTRLYRGHVNVRSGSLEGQNCIANCRGQANRRMTLADIDTDFDETEDNDPE